MSNIRNGWYVVPYEIAWRDLDAMGHVNNAVALSLLETARTKYWTDLHGTMSVDAIGFIVARIECDYRRELNLGDEVEIAVRIGTMRNSSFDFDGEVRRDGGRELAISAVVTVVLFSWETRSKLPITPELRARIGAFQGGAPPPA